MAKGSLAKENLINSFIKANPKDYIGCYDKKYYFWADENGEKIQVAVSMTCPKTPVEATPTPVGGDFNFDEDAPKGAITTSFEPVEVTQEEKDNIRSIMEKLGL